MDKRIQVFYTAISLAYLANAPALRAGDCAQTENSSSGCSGSCCYSYHQYYNSCTPQYCTCTGQQCVGGQPHVQCCCSRSGCFSN